MEIDVLSNDAYTDTEKIAMYCYLKNRDNLCKQICEDYINGTMNIQFISDVSKNEKRLTVMQKLGLFKNTKII